MRNFEVIELLEDELATETVDGLLQSEMERQEQELRVLADGISPYTRATLASLATKDALVGEHASRLRLQTLP